MSTQSQITATLALRAIAGMGIDPSEPVSDGPAYDLYYRIASQVQDWRTSRDKQAVQNEYNQLRLALKHHSNMTDYALKLAQEDGKDRRAYMQAISGADKAVWGAHARIGATNSAFNESTYSKVRDAVNKTTRLGVVDTAWSTLTGTLTKQTALGRTPDVHLPGLIAMMKRDGYDVNKIKDSTIKAQAEDLIGRAEAARASIDSYDKAIKSGQAEHKRLMAAISKQDGKDKSDLLRKLSNNTLSLNETFRLATGGAEEGLAKARVKELDSDIKSLEILESRLAKLDEQLFQGRGLDAERKRFAQVIGRDNFREWALDNGYTEQDIGIVEFDEEGKPIMSTYVPGRHTTKAIKHFEWQWKNPGKQAGLFRRIMGAPGKKADEIWVVTTKASQDRINKLKHTDKGGNAVWYTTKGADGIETYVTRDEMRSQTEKYGKPAVLVQGTVFKANDTYYQYDPKKKSFTPLDEKPGTWDDTKAVAVLQVDADNKPTRFANEDDITEGRLIPNETSKKANEGDVKALAARLPKYTAHSSPPENASIKIIGRRMRITAGDVAGKDRTRTRLEDVNTGQIITLNADEIASVDAYQTRSRTSFGDFVDSLQVRGLKQMADRAMGGDPGVEAVQKRTGPGGVVVNDYGASMSNLYDTAMGIGPDLKLTKQEREDRDAKEKAKELKPQIKAAAGVADKAIADADKAKKNFADAEARVEAAKAELKAARESGDVAKITLAKSKVKTAKKLSREAYTQMQLANRARKDAIGARSGLEVQVDPMADLTDVPEDLDADDAAIRREWRNIKMRMDAEGYAEGVAAKKAEVDRLEADLQKLRAAKDKDPEAIAALEGRLKTAQYLLDQADLSDDFAAVNQRLDKIEGIRARFRDDAPKPEELLIQVSPGFGGRGEAVIGAIDEVLADPNASVDDIQRALTETDAMVRAVSEGKTINLGQHKSVEDIAGKLKDKRQALYGPIAQAREALRAGKHDDAYKLYADALRKKGLDPTVEMGALTGLAQAAAGKGDYKAARKVMNYYTMKGGDPKAPAFDAIRAELTTRARAGSAQRKKDEAERVRLAEEARKARDTQQAALLAQGRKQEAAKAEAAKLRGQIEALVRNPAATQQDIDLAKAFQARWAAQAEVAGLDVGAGSTEIQAGLSKAQQSLQERTKTSKEHTVRLAEIAGMSPGSAEYIEQERVRALAETGGAVSPEERLPAKDMDPFLAQILKAKVEREKSARSAKKPKTKDESGEDEWPAEDKEMAEGGIVGEEGPERIIVGDGGGPELVVPTNVMAEMDPKVLERLMMLIEAKKTGLQGEEKDSPKRLAEALAQPGARSPTPTERPDTPMVPSVSDKDKANAAALVRVNREIRQTLMGSDEEGVV